MQESDDGRVLLYAFCGCQTEDVLGALGLTLADLFERPLGQLIPPSSSRISARDLLELLLLEIDCAAIILASIVEGRDCSEVAWQRLAKCSSRIGAAKMHISGR